MTETKRKDFLFLNFLSPVVRIFYLK